MSSKASREKSEAVRPLVQRMVVASALWMGTSLWSGCFWPPALEDLGYGKCETDADCEAGRYCLESRCSEAAWGLSSHQNRRSVRANYPEASLLTGNQLYRVRIGSEGELPFDDYRGAQWLGASNENPVLLNSMVETYDDMLVAWVRSNEPPRHGKGFVGYLYTDTSLEGDIELEQSAVELFDARMGDWFTADGVTIDAQSYRIEPNPEDAEVIDGHLRLSRNQQVYWRLPIGEPATVSLQFQLSGSDCTNISFGFVGNDGNGLPFPSALFFIPQNQSTRFEYTANADSQRIEYEDGGIVFDNILDSHWLRFVRADGHVRIDVDDQKWYDSRKSAETLDAFGYDIQGEPEDVYLTVDLDGNCFVEILDGWLSNSDAFAAEIEVGNKVRQF